MQNASGFSAAKVSDIARELGKHATVTILIALGAPLAGGLGAFGVNRFVEYETDRGCPVDLREALASGESALGKHQVALSHGIAKEITIKAPNCWRGWGLWSAVLREESQHIDPARKGDMLEQCESSGLKAIALGDPSDRTRSVVRDCSFIAADL